MLRHQPGHNGPTVTQLSRNEYVAVRQCSSAVRGVKPTYSDVYLLLVNFSNGGLAIRLNGLQAIEPISSRGPGITENA